MNSENIGFQIIMSCMSESIVWTCSKTSFINFKNEKGMF